MDSITFVLSIPDLPAKMAAADANALISAEARAVSYAGAPQVYVGLHTNDPGPTGLFEVAGGGYLRQPVAFSPPASGVASNMASVDFTNLPGATIRAVGLYSSQVGGTPFQWGWLTAATVVAPGGSFSFPIGQLIEEIVGA